MKTFFTKRLLHSLLAVALLGFAGCATDRISGGGELQSLNVDSRCAVVIGKIKIEQDGKDFTRKAILGWARIAGPSYREHSQPILNSYGYQVRSSDGYILTTLPLGKYNFIHADNTKRISNVWLGETTQPLPKSLQFEIARNDRVYDLGNITVQWTKDPHRAAKFWGAVPGILFFPIPLGFGPTNDAPKPVIAIQSNLEDAKKYFQTQFPKNNLQIEKVVWSK